MVLTYLPRHGVFDVMDVSVSDLRKRSELNSPTFFFLLLFSNHFASFSHYRR